MSSCDDLAQPLAHNMHRAGWKSSWCSWSRGGLSSSSFRCLVGKRSWNLWNSQNVSGKVVFPLALCCDFFFQYNSLKNQFWAVCSRILHIDQNCIQVANSRAAARSVSEPSLQSVTPCLPCSCLRGWAVSLFFCALSSVWILPSSLVGCGFRLAGFSWVLFRWAQTRQLGLFLVSRHHSDKAVKYKDCNNAADLGWEC